jgi:hypothetical protein
LLSEVFQNFKEANPKAGPIKKEETAEKLTESQ